MLVYSINTYLANNSTLQGLMGGTVNIQPMVGAEDTVGPYVLYWIYPHTKGPENYWFRRDIIKYEVWDTDVARCISIGEQIIKLLNIADNLQRVVANGAITGVDSGVIPKYSFLTRGSLDPPGIKQGWVSYRIMLELGWVS